MQTGRPEAGVKLIDEAIAVNPAIAPAHNNRGNALLELKRWKEALASFDEAVALKPDYADAYNNRGNALLELKQPAEALASYDKALSLRPNHADAYYNRGRALIALMRPDEALASYDKSLALMPGSPDVHFNRGNVLLTLNRLDEALASYDKTLSLDPDYIDAHNNRGTVLRNLRRLDEALTSCDRALSLKPDYAYVHHNRGTVLAELQRLEEALASFDQALQLMPDNADFHNSRGSVLRELGRFDEALASFDKVMTLKPDFDFIFGKYLHTKMLMCDWHSLQEDLDRYARDISDSKKVTVPFAALSLVDSPELHKTAVKIYSEQRYDRSQALGPLSRRDIDGKIRLGYYSADFVEHAVAHLIAEMMEEHDKQRFELYGFYFGRHTNMQNRVCSAFDKFFDVRSMSNRDVARLSRGIGIDIAVDLMGYTKDSRPGIFAERCAPIQINYLGYPGTMGADYIDYVIADKTVIPEERRSDFTEKVVYLPHSYLVNDSKRKISERIFAREELGLPKTGFVFCGFTNIYKILPASFDGWMNILKAVEGSVLWLQEYSPIAVKNLRREAEARGVAGGRLIFAGRMPLHDEHLARYRLADLFLDTLPYNAHTTASDALWAGLPVLTCMGKSFASRVAASLLNAVGLPDLVTTSQDEFEAKAIDLATNADKLREIKVRLERNKVTSPLFDGRIFARHIESAYETMFARYQDGLPPAAIEVRA